MSDKEKLETIMALALQIAGAVRIGAISEANEYINRVIDLCTEANR